MNRPNFFIKCIAWESILAAGISAAGAATAAGATAGAQAAANKKQLQNWIVQTAIQRQLDQEAREYNLPANQMRRYIDAGLNPNLIAGGGAGNTTNSTDVPAAPSVRPVDYSGFGSAVDAAVGRFFEVQSALKSRELIDQQINESKAREKSYDAMASLNTAKSAIELLRGKSFGELDYFGNIARRSAQQLINSVYQNGILSENLDFLMKYHPLQIKNISARTSDILANTKLKNQLFNFNSAANPYRLGIFQEQQSRYSHINSYTDAAASLARQQASSLFDKDNDKYTDKIFDFILNSIGSLIFKGKRPLKIR